MGVVYTPNEVVEFIVRGVDHLLQKHFDRRLADGNVQILDPAVGTGTFVTNLIDYLPADRLEYKYLNEIHANEVAILPYYIANLNIEYSYREKTGRYLEFPNLVFVDTLDNVNWEGATGGAVARTGRMDLGAFSEENWLRVQGQNKKTISVIMGNPPYNANAILWGDGRDNWPYPEVDGRISDTYVKQSKAQKTKQYDMYKRFIRWASDRLADDGVIAFVTNRAYLDTRQDDGFRQVAAEEFTDIYLMDLGSDVRRNPKISGTTHNVFGIQTGVAIGFFVRDKSRLGECSIYYARREDAELARDKLAYLREARLEEIAFEEIVPDSKNNWLNQSNSDFEKLLLLAGRESNEGRSVFRLSALGVNTARDEWVYDFDVGNLGDKARFFADTYNELLEANDESYEPIIKWSRDLSGKFRRKRQIAYDGTKRTEALYRPFIKKNHVADFVMNDVLTKSHSAMFGPDFRKSNSVINFSMKGRHFYALVADKLTDWHFTGDTYCLPLYRYTDDGERVSNITQWGLDFINDHYRRECGEDFGEMYPKEITAEHIFAYTYAVLHDPVYRHDYAVDLTQELPRLPLYHDFDTWARMGQQLLDLHIGFESAEPYPLEQVDLKGDVKRVILGADKEQGRIVLDDKTTLTGVPEDAWRYRLGSRSALEWVLDQYKERKPRDPTIAEMFNTYSFADYKERVIDLLRRLCTVSVETMEIVDGMAYWLEDGRLAVFGDRDKHEWAMLGMSQWAKEPED